MKSNPIVSTTRTKEGPYIAYRVTFLVDWAPMIFGRIIGAWRFAGESYWAASGITPGPNSIALLGDLPGDDGRIFFVPNELVTITRWRRESEIVTVKKDTLLDD